MVSEDFINEISIIGSFVQVSNTRIGVIVGHQHTGGVFRGHCNIWFGSFATDGRPQIEHLCIMEDWEMVETPVGGN